MTETPPAPLIVERHGAVFERHIYCRDGLNLVAWIIRPPGNGPFPLLVNNHGCGIVRGADGAWVNVSARYTIDPDNPAWARVAANGALTLFPQGRGYGGSDGPNPVAAVRNGIDATFAMLSHRADDANAAVDWACRRTDVDGTRCVITGASHGAVVALLAAAKRPYGAVIAQATGAAFGSVEASVRPIANAAACITAAVLYQHMRTDTLVPASGARAIFDWSSRFRPLHRWRDYPGTSGVEGHNVFDPANAQQLRPDALDAIRAGFECPPSSPKDDAPQWLELDYLLPAGLRRDAPRWSGRFGADGPDAMVVLDGERAMYCWKDRDSRGFGGGTISRCGEAISVEPWPGVSLTLRQLSENALQITYEQNGIQHVTRLRPVVTI